MGFYEPGKTISFRLPQNTPKSVIEHLNKRKIELGRNFSSEIAPLFVNSIDNSFESNQADSINIPLPSNLSLEQREWLNSSYTKTLLSQLIHQVVNHQLTSPFSFDGDGIQNVSKQTEDIEPEQKSFKVNSTTSSFIQKTFLNFDDDDDD
ncbi:hypothetical protein [Niallia taxi]|uniref:hypothetical protein n=1 Tax=Niallia taxi TaxID=2499688 RepID=UPI002E22BFAA|nr:hypothetical protein [Niallia taxi]